MTLKEFIQNNRNLINQKKFNELFDLIEPAQIPIYGSYMTLGVVRSNLAYDLFGLLMKNGINAYDIALLSRPSYVSASLLSAYTTYFQPDHLTLPSSISEIHEFSDIRFIKTLDLSRTQIKILEQRICTSGNLERILLPDGLVEIKSEAICGPNDLKLIAIPDSVEIIKSKAFYNCNKVKQVFLPKNLKKFNSSCVTGHAMTPKKLKYTYNGPDITIQQKVEADNNRRASL